MDFSPLSGATVAVNRLRHAGLRAHGDQAARILQHQQGKCSQTMYTQRTRSLLHTLNHLDLDVSA